MPATNRNHYTGNYTKQARAITTAAAADPTTICWRCKRTAAQHPPGRWTAGHVIDANPNSPLLPEWSTCNSSAGASNRAVTQAAHVRGRA